MGWVLIAFGYIALAFVQTYFLAGARGRCRRAAARRHAPTSAAPSRSPIRGSTACCPWAVVSATVSIILNQLERYGIVGRIVASLIGLAWNLVTFLTIPILVIEDVGVVDAFKRSKELFKKTWGENVVGQAGLGIARLRGRDPRRSR